MNEQECEDKGMAYDCDLDVQLLAMIGSYEDGRKDFWRKKREGIDWDQEEGLLGHAEQIATVLLRSTGSLASTQASKKTGEQFNVERTEFLAGIHESRNEYIAVIKTLIEKAPDIKARCCSDPVHYHRLMLRGYASRSIDDRPEQDSLLKLVWERFCIDLAKELIEDQLIPAANRLFQLVDLIVDVGCSAPTVTFLQRISRCYVWGHHPECVILCRGAMETAFEEKITDRMCKKQADRASRYGYTLCQRIHIAHKESMINKKAKDTALRVNKTANSVAHDRPVVLSDVFEVVRETLFVIQQLGKS